MLSTSQQTFSLFVDRTTLKWIVRDGEGNFWAVLFGPGGWEQREPFFPTDETELESIPGHYKVMFHLPI